MFSFVFGLIKSFFRSLGFVSNKQQESNTRNQIPLPSPTKTVFGGLQNVVAGAFTKDDTKLISLMEYNGGSMQIIQQKLVFKNLKDAQGLPIVIENTDQLRHFYGIFKETNR